MPLALTIAPSLATLAGFIFQAEMVAFLAVIASPGLSLAAGIILGRYTGLSTNGKAFALLGWTIASFCVSILLQFAGCSQLGSRFGG